MSENIEAILDMNEEELAAYQRTLLKKVVKRFAITTAVKVAVGVGIVILVKKLTDEKDSTSDSE